MKIGIIGLGRMGANIGRRLMRGGHQVVGFDRCADAVQALVANGGEGVDSLEAVKAKLDRPAIWWVMRRPVATVRTTPRVRATKVTVAPGRRLSTS